MLRMVLGEKLIGNLTICTVIHLFHNGHVEQFIKTRQLFCSCAHSSTHHSFVLRMIVKLQKTLGCSL
jgi:hypothetical protein